MKKITILVPCYNEEASLPLMYAELRKLMDTQQNYEWEILLINDGSKDNTLNIIKQLRSNDKRICYVSLSRNFGKERAMLAGFDYATGDCMVIIDADLQHPPKLIPEMLKIWETGVDDVYAKRITRGKESWLRKNISLLYYKIINKLGQQQGGVLQNVGDFRLLDRKCIEVLKQLRESERYTKGMYSWIGFKKEEILFEQGDRIAGKSSFNFWKLTNLALEGITSYSTAPLRFSTWCGCIVSLAAFVYMCMVIAKTLFWGEPVRGYTTLIVVILFLGGVQLLSLGIIGEYLGKAFNESKQRPVYVIGEKETNSNLQDENKQ